MNIFTRIFRKKNDSISNISEINQTPLFTHISPKQENILSSYEIIYIESQYHPHVNKYIVDNTDEIKHFFDSEGKDFVYLPLKKEMLKELIVYNYPDIVQDNLNENTIDLYIQEIYNYLYQAANNDINDKAFCGLVTYNTSNSDSNPFKYYNLPYDTENEIELSMSFKITLKEKVHTNSSKDGISLPLFKISDPWKEWYYEGSGYWADEYFSRESKQIIKEVWKKVNQLEAMGVSLNALQKILSIGTPRKLSRIIITSSFQIYLPDYNNVEIIMSPLPKAVFMLFLKHSEGILFKKLHNYKPELMEIYQQISSREDMIKSKQSISDLTDPTKNSINEKCSRIREAFIQHFDDDIAKYYYITGERSMPKKILIDRNLVEWQ